MSTQIHGLKQSILKDQQENGLKILELDNEFCRAKIAYQGAQVLSFFDKTHSQDLLWCSDKNTFKNQKAIRGGIPLCFPWFGAHETRSDLPSHGFARNQDWQLKSAEYQLGKGHYLVFTLRDNAETRQYWDYAFQIELEICLGKSLALNLKVSNLDQKTLEFTFAWHSYFAVSDIHDVKIKGLENTAFIDKLSEQKSINLEDHPIIFNQEIDRIYPLTQQQYVIHNDHQTQIKSQNCQSAVVWNPWQEKTARLGDLALDDWQKFVCLECGNLNNAKQTLIVGQTKNYHMHLGLAV